MTTYDGLEDTVDSATVVVQRQKFPHSHTKETVAPQNVQAPTWALPKLGAAQRRSSVLSSAVLRAVDTLPLYSHNLAPASLQCLISAPFTLLSLVQW